MYAGSVEKYSPDEISDKKMKIYMLRHGESDANVKKIFCHRGCELGLTEKGRDQVKHFIEAVNGIEFGAVYVSPLTRALQTADIIAEKLNFKYEVTDSLYEFDVGVMEGKLDKESWSGFRDIVKDWLVEKKWDNRIEKGESYNDIVKRFMPFIESVKQKYGKTDINVLLIGHSGLFRCVLPFICVNVPYEYSYESFLGNGQYIIIEPAGDRFICKEWAGSMIP
jgi:broad specificity phosphatase PhoE